jgi:hypothetical protein
VSSEFSSSLCGARPSVFTPLLGAFAKEVVEPPVKQGLFRKGFLNPRLTVLAPSAVPREVNDVGVVGPSSPLSGCIIPSFVEGNGFSQSWNWHVGFDYNGDIVIGEEEDDFWDGLDFGE